LTLGDYLGGLFAMIVEGAIQAGLNKLLSPLGDTGAAIAGLFIGSPLGFSFNANGTGPVGAVGRATGMLATLARSVGESLAGALTGNEGDLAAGRGDRADVAKKNDDENASLKKDGRFGKWNIDGKEQGNEGDGVKLVGAPFGVLRGIFGAAADAFATPAAPTASPTSAAFDNPNAEQF
jgi:hypothetical protein